MRILKSVSVIFCVIGLLSSCGFEVVDTGYRGVITKFGKVSGESLEEGLWFYNPITSDIIEMDVRVQKIEKKISTYTKDIQQAEMTVVLMTNLKKDSAHLMLKDYGTDWGERIVPQILEGFCKSVIGKWNAVDLIENREVARLEIEKGVREALSDKYVDVIKIELTNIDYNDQFEKAVENKVVAIQSAIEAQNKTKQIEEEARQQVISAKAEAESMKIRAQALTQNAGLVSYEFVNKWNGVLPVIMGGNGGNLLNIPEALLKGKNDK